MGKIKLKRKLVNWLINVQVFKYVAEVVIWKNSNPEHRSLEFREKHGIELDDVVICFDGRLVDEKWSDIFADVICRMEQQQLPNTVYIGWFNGQELATAYASSDIFIFPSALESMDNITFEAAGSNSKNNSRSNIRKLLRDLVDIHIEMKLLKEKVRERKLYFWKV